MKSVVFAWRDLGVAGLEALWDRGMEILRVYTHEPGPSESGWYKDAAAFSLARGVPVSTAVDVASPPVIAELGELRPDFIFLFDYQLPVGRQVLRAAARGVFMLHPSLLPGYPGPEAVVRALLDGEKKTGVSLVRLEVESGQLRLIDQAEIYIAKEDDHVTLYRRLAALGKELLLENLPRLISAQAQENPLPLLEKRPPAIDCRIDWGRSSWEVYNKIRALTRPLPGAYTTFHGEKMIIWKAVPDDASCALLHTREIEVEEGRVLAGTSFGSLRLEEIEWKGKLLHGSEIAEFLAPYWQEKLE